MTGHSTHFFSSISFSFRNLPSVLLAGGLFLSVGPAVSQGNFSTSDGFNRFLLQGCRMNADSVLAISQPLRILDSSASSHAPCACRNSSGVIEQKSARLIPIAPTATPSSSAIPAAFFLNRSLLSRQICYLPPSVSRRSSAPCPPGL